MKETHTNHGIIQVEDEGGPVLRIDSGKVDSVMICSSPHA